MYIYIYDTHECFDLSLETYLKHFITQTKITNSRQNDHYRKSIILFFFFIYF